MSLHFHENICSHASLCRNLHILSSCVQIKYQYSAVPSSQISGHPEQTPDVLVLHRCSAKKILTRGAPATTLGHPSFTLPLKKLLCMSSHEEKHVMLCMQPPGRPSAPFLLLLPCQDTLCLFGPCGHWPSEVISLLQKCPITWNSNFTVSRGVGCHLACSRFWCSKIRATVLCS